jgi:hypothetical protein
VTEILARLTNTAAPVITGDRVRLQWMPGGRHTITPHSDGGPVNLDVEIRAEDAAKVQAAFDALCAAGQHRPYFDLEHDDKVASVWPQSFEWSESPAPGIYAEGVLTSAGREAIEGKTHRGFSAVFYVDGVANKPARIEAKARLNMGGFTNNPAFKKSLPLWAKEAQQDSAAPAAVATETETKNMSEQATAVPAAPAPAPAASLPDSGAIAAKESEITALRAKLAKSQEQIELRAKADAQAAVAAAVKRGAIPAADTALQAKWQDRCEKDPTAVELLAAIPDSPLLASGRLTGGSVQVGAEDVRRVMRAFDAEKNPMERGLIYARELRAKLNDPRQADAVIMAADTYSTTLVVQRTLDLLKWTYPMLSRITSDMSPEAASYGDAITTRTVGAATVGTYNTSTGYAVTNATTTDVAVTMNAHKFVEVGFNANVVASTRRRLYDEQVEAAQNGLAKDLSDALLALITAANFTNTPIERDEASFERADIIALGKALTEAKVPLVGRTLLLNPAYYAALAKDTTIVSALINNGAGAAIASGKLPPVHGFELLEQGNLPSTGNLTGFGYNRSALVLATRTPSDYASALPGAPATGNVQIVTNPEDGFSVAMTQYVDHALGIAKWRIALMYGVAKGQVAAGTIVRSAAP